MATACAWVAFGLFVIFGVLSGMLVFDLEFVKLFVSVLFMGVVNLLFEALFNSLGVVSATYACLMMFGAKGNKLLFFVVLCVGVSFVFGFFVFGLYLVICEL